MSGLRISFIAEGVLWFLMLLTWKTVCVCGGGSFSSGDRGKQISEGMTVNA